MATKTEPVSPGREIRVTPRQVLAAKIAVKAEIKLGRTPHPGLRRIAEAKRAD